MKPNSYLLTAALLIAGALLGQLVRAEAQTSAKVYRECVGVRTWVYSGKDINDGDPITKSLKIPAGWTPIAGGGETVNRDGMVILCK